MTLAAGTLERHDIANTRLVDLIERPIERGNKLAGGRRFERDFMLSVGRDNEDKTASDFNLRRCFPEITLTHARSPDTSIRQGECGSFVINTQQQLTNFNLRSSNRATAHCASGPEHLVPLTRSGPFSIALET